MNWSPEVTLQTPMPMIELALEGKLDFLENPLMPMRFPAAPKLPPAELARQSLEAWRAFKARRKR